MTCNDYSCSCFIFNKYYTFLLGLSVTNKKGKKILNIYFVYQYALKDGLADVTFYGLILVIQ